MYSGDERFFIRQRPGAQSCLAQDRGLLIDFFLALRCLRDRLGCGQLILQSVYR